MNLTFALSPASNRLRRDCRGRFRRAVQHRLPFAAVVRGQRRAGAGGAHGLPGGLGWNLEAASFAAALTVGAAVQVLRARTDISQNALDVVGCIPMVPGSFAAKAILGMFALTSTSTVDASETLITAVQFALRVTFTIGAIGTGLAIPTLLLRVRVTR